VIVTRREADLAVVEQAPRVLRVEKMLKSREEAQSLREALSFTKKKEDDPLMAYLVDFRERIRHARELLTDPARTAFFFVTLPEALPIAVIRRFIDWFTDFGIPVGGVIVNMVIRPETGEAAPDFVRNRIEMQSGYLDEIERVFDGEVRAVVPLFDSDIRGVPSLEKAARNLFA
jgi:arsenite-transporting ATPase